MENNHNAIFIHLCFVVEKWDRLVLTFFQNTKNEMNFQQPSSYPIITYSDLGIATTCI